MTSVKEAETSLRCTKRGPSETYRYDQSPAYVICQYCRCAVTTTVIFESGLLTWSVAALLCLTACWCGCCLIPFCIKQTKDAIHVCPACGNVLHVYRNY